MQVPEEIVREVASYLAVTDLVAMHRVRRGWRDATRDLVAEQVERWSRIHSIHFDILGPSSPRRVPRPLYDLPLFGNLTLSIGDTVMGTLSDGSTYVLGPGGALTVFARVGADAGADAGVGAGAGTDAGAGAGAGADAGVGAEATDPLSP